MELEFLARSCRDIPDLPLMSDRDFGKVFPGVLPPNQITAPTGRASAGTAHEDGYGKRESTLSVIFKASLYFPGRECWPSDLVPWIEGSGLL
ncbi:hypothetical protein EV146_102215 [Mesobacillus foraminis]|uniref:Uncharacterized protein n=1 Tax=Mesobacillus foraminis TaxID=279826 RepID=A0A4R2BJB1_9BACI|nr:hypothetical protein EV146_102215 [Mesobacillus foraminis]